MEAHQLINQDSGDTERYTPSYIIEAVRDTMGEIDLDPASCAIANERIKATRFFTKEDDGLKQEWRGRVWLNHPFSKGEEICKNPDKCKKKCCVKRGHHCKERVPSNAEWIDHLMQQFRLGWTSQFCCITFASLSERWFAPLQDFIRCEPYERVNYHFPDGSLDDQVPKGSVITYGGPHPERFKAAFKHIGWIRGPV